VKHAKRAVPVDPVHLRRTAINPADIGASLIGPVDIAHGQRDLRTEATMNILTAQAWQSWVLRRSNADCLAETPGGELVG